MQMYFYIRLYKVLNLIFVSRIFLPFLNTCDLRDQTQAKITDLDNEHGPREQKAVLQ